MSAGIRVDTPLRSAALLIVRFACGGRLTRCRLTEYIVGSVESTPPLESYVHAPITNAPRFHWKSLPFRALIYFTTELESVNLALKSGKFLRI